MITGVSMELGGLMRQLARLKNVPIEKVVRNASRDFVMGAYTAAPVAKKSRSLFARVTLRNGQIAYLNITRAASQSARAAAKGKGSAARARTRARLEKYRVRIMKGFSRSTWIGAMRSLGMHSKHVGNSLPTAVAWMSRARQTIDTKTVAAYEIRDINLDFKALPMARRNMVSAGEKRAIDFMRKAIRKELDKA